MHSTPTWQSNQFEFFDFGGLHIFFLFCIAAPPTHQQNPQPSEHRHFSKLDWWSDIHYKTCLVCHLTTVIRQPSSMDVPCCGVLHLVVLRSEQPTQCSSMTKRPCFLGPTEVHLELIQGVQASFSRSSMALCWLFCGESAQTPPCRLLVQSGVLVKHSPGKP